MLTIQGITYTHANKDVLFDQLHLAINKKEKVALVGNNGSGKSTLLKIIAGDLKPASGIVNVDSIPYYIPQLTGQYDSYTIAEVLQVSVKIEALKKILAGEGTEEQLAILADDWSIEERCGEALSYWGLKGADLMQQMATLSGGQKTKVFLSGIAVHKPEFILMDEPSNHLDQQSRDVLYEWIQTTNATLIVVSHDRMLLNLLPATLELTNEGIATYGGNYDFYAAQKSIENNALQLDIKNKERTLRKAKEIERETMERQQKLDARGKKKQEKAGLPTISMKTFKNNAEKSTARTKDIHTEKIQTVAQELTQLRNELPDADKIKFGFDQSRLHKGKVLIRASGINIQYAEKPLWKEPLTLEIMSGTRIVLKGNNGSGKTSFVKILLGQLLSHAGTVYKSADRIMYIDQEYSIINNALNVYEQASRFNTSGLQEHELKIRLNRFLFQKDSWDKSCSVLSGGERMRLLLCCLTIAADAPDMIILDEPTNNLDLQNIEILTSALQAYKGTLILISHDAYFLQQIGVEQIIELEKM